MPKYLYHYTSIQALKSIVEDRYVWANAAGYSNDPKEFRYAMKMVGTEFWSLSAHWPKTAEWRKLRSDLELWFEVAHTRPLYLFCLSESPNHLSQWCRYCPEDGGYAIWFATRRLARQLKAQGFRLVRCEYDPEVQRRRIRATLSGVLDGLPDLTRFGGDETKLWEVTSPIQLDLIERIYTLVAAYKHPAFQKEKEWRAVKLDRYHHLQKNFHIKGTVMVPHFELKLNAVSGLIPIQHVTVGPGLDQDLAAYGLEDFLEEDGIHVTVSNASYKQLRILQSKSRLSSRRARSARAARIL